MRLVYFILLLAAVSSCSPVSKGKLLKSVREAETASRGHTGFMLYDPVARKVIAEQHADRYFTPASNTKIFTMFASLKLLGDSIPALRYIVRGDSLIFWGTGDPSFLYRNVFDSGKTFAFLSQSPYRLFYSPANFHTTHFGPGWSWDDYNYTYSSERSSLPVYGNMYEVHKLGSRLFTVPAYFQKFIEVSADSMDKATVTRSPFLNKLTYHPGAGNYTRKWNMPYVTDPSLVVQLLADTLRKSVRVVNEKPVREAGVLYSIHADSLYRVLMQDSDNFIAEQLLLLCAGVLSDSLKPEIALEYVKKNFLHDLPDEPVWVDGSGLSRYNQFTPRSVIAVWEKLFVMIPRERLFSLLAIGGRAGTIKNLYKADEPYIFGKTGTLSNVHCLSGYLVTKRGKVLLFAFMNNNFTVPTRDVRTRMEGILALIREHYK